MYQRRCHVPPLPVHQNLGRHPPNWKTGRGVVQLLNGGVQRVGEAEVGHFCNCAFLSEQDVPEKPFLNVHVFSWFLVRHLAARSPCTILCCSRNSIPRLTCPQAKTSSFSVLVSSRKLLPESYISQESCCSMAQTPTGSGETTVWVLIPTMTSDRMRHWHLLLHPLE